MLGFYIPRDLIMIGIGYMLCLLTAYVYIIIKDKEYKKWR